MRLAKSTYLNIEVRGKGNLFSGWGWWETRFGDIFSVGVVGFWALFSIAEVAFVDFSSWLGLGSHHTGMAQ